MKIKLVRLGAASIALVILQSGLCLLPQCLLATVFSISDLAGLELPQVQKPRKMHTIMPCPVTVNLSLTLTSGFWESSWQCLHSPVLPGQ